MWLLLLLLLLLLLKAAGHVFSMCSSRLHRLLHRPEQYYLSPGGRAAVSLD